jgi:hypothetical protein
MPNGWVHATIDLLVFGRSYFDLHQKKDKEHQTLGPDHRIIDHDWYQGFGKFWTFSEPFPGWLKQYTQTLRDTVGEVRAEEEQSSVTHEYIDRIWDDLLTQQRRYWESFFMWVLLHPDVLRDRFGVDVLNGKIHRVIEGQEIWEDCPDVKVEYKRLRRYVAVVRSNSQTLQDMLERYE